MADGFSTRRRVMPRMRGIVCGVRLDRGGKAFARTHALCAGNAIGEHDLVACAAQAREGVAGGQRFCCQRIGFGGT